MHMHTRSKNVGLHGRVEKNNNLNQKSESQCKCTALKKKKKEAEVKVRAAQCVPSLVVLQQSVKVTSSKPSKGMSRTTRSVRVCLPPAAIISCFDGKKQNNRRHFSNSDMCICCANDHLRNELASLADTLEINPLQCQEGFGFLSICRPTCRQTPPRQLFVLLQEYGGLDKAAC